MQTFFVYSLHTYTHTLKHDDPADKRCVAQPQIKQKYIGIE